MPVRWLTLAGKAVLRATLARLIAGFDTDLCLQPVAIGRNAQRNRCRPTLCHIGCDRQAESGPFRPSGTRDKEKALKHRLGLMCGDARTGVADLNQPCIIAGRSNHHMDPAGCREIFHGILEYILKQQA